VRDAFERQRHHILARLLLRLAMAARAERFARQFRQIVPIGAPVERAAERDTGLDAFVESGGARRVVAAEADTPHAEARAVEIAPRADVIEHGLHGHLVVAANREIVLRLALAGAFKHQRRQSARQKWRLVGVSFLLGRIEPDRHRHYRRLFGARGLAQDTGQSFALIRNLDPFARWPQVRQRQLPAFDLLLVRGLHLRLVLHKQERSKMKIDAGALQAFAGGKEMFLRQRRTAERFVMRGARRPGPAPVVIRRHRAGDLFEVGQHDAVGDKARAPMRDGGLEPWVGRRSRRHSAAWVDGLALILAQ